MSVGPSATANGKLFSALIAASSYYIISIIAFQFHRLGCMLFYVFAYFICLLYSAQGTGSALKVTRGVKVPLLHGDVFVPPGCAMVTMTVATTGTKTQLDVVLLVNPSQ